MQLTRTTGGNGTGCQKFRLTVQNRGPDMGAQMTRNGLERCANESDSQKKGETLRTTPRPWE